ncbi:MAG TPA: hypothetical protein VLA88_00760, partial [Candidatus Saccharimonadales bacterium]|nr:hypothetical protein [Candidatus Saccharimonadales bacterium]
MDNNLTDIHVPNESDSRGVQPSATIGYGDAIPAQAATVSAPQSQPIATPPASPDNPRPTPKSPLSKKLLIKYGGTALLILLIIVGIIVVAINLASRKPNDASTASRFNTVTLPLDEFATTTDSGLNLLGTRSLVINGPLLANASFSISPSAQPSNANRGQIYYDQTDNQLAYYNGTKFVKLNDSGVQNINGLSGAVALGGGLTVTNNQITNSGVLSLQGQTGNVTLTAGDGIVIDGTTISATGGGVTSINGQDGAIVLGSGLSISGDTLRNSGIISAAAGSGITVINDGNGNITISNSGAGSGTVNSPGGTNGRIAKFTGVQSIADSLLSETGTTVTVNGDLSVTGSLALGTALSVGNGGTGSTALANNGVVVGQGSGALTAVTAGGAGLCLMSTAGAPAFQACPGGGGGVTSLNGLTGALSIANASAAGSTITINDASTAQKGIAQFNSTNFTAASGTVNTIQNINTTATPTFNGVNTNNITPSGALTVGATGQQFTLQGNASSVINATSGINSTTLAFQSPTATVTYRFATAAAGTYDVCTMVGNCAGVGGGVTTAGGTSGTLPVFTGTQAIGDSLVSQSGGTVTVNGNLNLTAGNQYRVNGTQISSANLSNDANLAKLNGTQTFTGATNTFQNTSDSALAFSIQNASSNRIFSINTTSGTAILGQGSTLGGQLVFSNATNNNTVTIISAAPAASRTYTLPDVGGNASFCLSTGNCAGAGVTLQAAYNNSTTPEITVDATRGALTIRDAATPIGANLLEVQDNAGGTTYFAVTASGTNTTGTSTASGNLNTTGGGLQTNSTTRVDNSGNLTNIGNITGTGAITIASSGAGNDIIVNGADEFIVQDAMVANSQATFNADVDLTLADTENVNITNTVTGTNAVNLVSAVLTNNTSSGTQNVAFLQNAAGSGTTDGLLVLDNADTDTAVTNGIQITSAAGGVTTAIDVSDPDIVTALLFGANDITGANFSVTGGTGSFTSAGNGTIQGGTITVGTTSQAGSLVMSDGSSNTVTLQVGSFVGDAVYTIPNVGAAATFCMSTGNCGGAGVTLQTAYNNSTNPEIVLDATRGALTLRDNATPIGANLFEVQSNSGATTYLAVTASGMSVTGGATTTGNINSSGGALQTNGTSRVDNTGNLVNIGNITGTGAVTIASSGAGNDVTINGADEFIIQDAMVANGQSTFNTDVDFTLADTENVAITNTVTGTNAVNLIGAVLTNNTSSGTQQVALLQNAAGSGTTEGLLILDNADTDTAVANGIQITSAAGGVTTAIDVSDPDI